MTEPDDPEVIAMRERAERVVARRAKERSEARDTDKEAPRKKKGGRRWYHWVIDGALFLVAAYLIKTRFFDKQEPPAESAPKVQASASAAASANARTIASAPLRASPEGSAAPSETIAPNTPIEVIELSTTGFVKVRAPSGATGWVAAQSITTAP